MTTPQEDQQSPPGEKEDPDPWWARETFRLGSIDGIRVGVNWTVPGAFAAIAYVFAGIYLPGIYPYQSGAVNIGTGFAVGVVFVLSLLAHEMAHAVVAVRSKTPVERVILWAGGGATKMTGHAPSPAADLWISAAGPIANVVLGIAFGAVALGIGSAHGAAGVPLLALAWLGHINFLLAVTNLIPIMGMDGQRLLYGLAWWRTGDRAKGAAIAIRTGSVIGWAGVLGGLALYAATRSVYGLDAMLFGAFSVSGLPKRKRKRPSDAQVDCL